MIRVFRHYMQASVLALALVEALVLVAAFYVGVFARFADIGDFADELRVYASAAAIFSGVFLTVMYAVGVYQGDALADSRLMFLRTCVAYLLGFVVIAVLQYSLQSLAIWRSALAIAMPLSFVGLLATRRLCLPIMNLEAFRRRVLVLGAGDRATRVDRLARDPKTRGFTCVGCIPTPDEEVAVPRDRVRGNVSCLATTARQQRIDEIVVAVADRRKELPVEVLLDLKLDGVSVVDFASFWERETGRIDIDTTHPSWLIFSDGFGGSAFQRGAKRVFDLAVSASILVLALPLIMLTALAIWLESGRPIIYRQERIGRNGRIFTLHKFRSMRVDAENDGKPRWAEFGDPRVTRVGEFIRKTRIDELPQLYNVMSGDMSFVGPRPERPFFVERLVAKVPYYKERHRVKPGITGWAQINFPYGASPEDAKQKLQYDLYYIKNYSIFLDCIILLQTARVILWPNKAR